MRPAPCSSPIRDDGRWTAVLLPDLQNYTVYAENCPVLCDCLEWLVEEREVLGVELVLQVGDLTNRNREEEWVRARSAFSILDGALPYVLTVGNHDLGRTVIGESRFTRLNDFLRIDDNPLNAEALLGVYREYELENTASVFSLQGVEWLVLALEFGPRESVAAWADDVLSKHAEKPTLLVTHEFIDQLSVLKEGEARRTRPATHNSPHSYGLAGEPGGVHCGEDLWQRLVEPHSQIQLVVNGHYRPYAREADGRIVPWDGVAEASRVDHRQDGSIVHQHLFNAQWAPRGGDGLVKLLEFRRTEFIGARVVAPPLQPIGVHV